MKVLLTIPLGALLQVVLFVLLRWLGGMAAKPAATLVGLAAIALYMPWAILHWPGGDVVAMHVAIYGVTAYALGLIVANRDARLARHGGDEGWFHWAPAAIVAFFVLLVLFDGILVVVSTRGLPEPVARRLLPPPDASVETVTSAFPGVDSPDYQRQQLEYNRYLAQQRIQAERGWQVRKGWLQPALAGQESTFQVAVTDREGLPVSGAEVRGRFMRPSDTRLDQDFTMEEVMPGVYRARLVLPAPGAWLLDLEIRRGDDLHQLRARTRVQKYPGQPTATAD
ncbi:FixH family protein [Thiohalobacter sp.]|uniref:FixH family protein n=1 Tax=Thiohalobacter sp. TaxID=2025948 RepID=UPI002633412B|nr:FixH family protein [Thiohalobacter sp.]